MKQKSIVSFPPGCDSGLEERQGRASDFAFIHFGRHKVRQVLQISVLSLFSYFIYFLSQKLASEVPKSCDGTNYSPRGAAAGSAAFINGGPPALNNNLPSGLRAQSFRT